MTSSDIKKMRGDILALTVEYSELFLSKQTFTPGVSAIPVSGKVLESDDFVNLIDSSLDGWFTSGRYTKEFERSLADFVGVRSALFVNSGSSANLCALSGLT
ncbi:MAG: DegT/DnrJ/EryC1/StrS family aminotransferase, partial [Cytophagales bacterium]|nr:DegT/DnrJ/EryC1/StrS family aminotransferase [Cytophagales bacterium]